MARPTSRAVARTPTTAATPAPRGSTFARPGSSTSAVRSRAPNPVARMSCGGRRDAARERGARLTQGRPRRGQGRTRRVRWLGRAGRDEPRPDPLSRRRAHGRSARAVRGRGRRSGGPRADDATVAVERAIDRWVWYAGWADKIAQLLGTVNPVAGDYFDFTIPEATGVVGVVAPETRRCSGSSRDWRRSSSAATPRSSSRRRPARSRR